MNDCTNSIQCLWQHFTLNQTCQGITKDIRIHSLGNLNVQNCMASRQITVEILKSGLKWWTTWTVDDISIHWAMARVWQKERPKQLFCYWISPSTQAVDGAVSITVITGLYVGKNQKDQTVNRDFWVMLDKKKRNWEPMSGWKAMYVCQSCLTYRSTLTKNSLRFFTFA